MSSRLARHRALSAAIVARHRDASMLMGDFLRGMVEGDKRAQSLRATAP